ncbi:MAG: hypothetical protein Q9227_007920 [Pyrenula ochraceoflavens]
MAAKTEAELPLHSKSSASDSQTATITNPRGIPQAPFVSSVSDYVSSRAQVEPTLRSFSEMISKYQFMSTNVSRRAESLRSKIPEMKSTLEVVKFLRSQQSLEEGEGDEDLETTFSLNDTLFAKAKIRPKEMQEVYLWLGANVMVGYPMGEAEEMLRGKLEGAKTKLAECEEDGEFLKEQITTLEVATARVYNWDVMQKRLEKAQGKGEEDDGENSKRGG